MNHSEDYKKITYKKFNENFNKLWKHAGTIEDVNEYLICKKVVDEALDFIDDIEDIPFRAYVEFLKQAIIRKNGWPDKKVFDFRLYAAPVTSRENARLYFNYPDSEGKLTRMFASFSTIENDDITDYLLRTIVREVDKFKGDGSLRDGQTPASDYVKTTFFEFKDETCEKRWRDYCNYNLKPWQNYLKNDEDERHE